MGFPTRILAHREAQEIEAHLTLTGMQGVRDAGLRGVQLQAHRGQEGAHGRLGRFDRLAALVEDDEVISVPHQDRTTTRVLAGEPWIDRCCRRLFQAVQGDVGEER